jgi:hypothetical protein
MAKIDVTKVWALNYRLVTSVTVEVAPALHELGIEVKELLSSRSSTRIRTRPRSPKRC